MQSYTGDDILASLVICEPAALATGCWEWRGPLNESGYGETSLPDRKHVRVHCWVYERFRGPVPPGLVLDHLCRNRVCADFEHLEPVTRGENVRRGNAAKPRKTHCPQGHPYAGENLILDKDGRRYCRVCTYRRSREYLRRKYVPKPRPTCCKAGHPLSGDNLRVGKDGRRVCVTCARVRGRRWYHNHKDRPRARDR